MKLSHLILSFAVAGIAFAGTSHALRQDEGETMAPMPEAGSQHEIMKALAGEWDAEVSMMGQTSPGSMSSTLEMSGLWLVSRYEGQMMGSPFTGLGLMSYDPEKEKYVGLWIDSMTSAINPSEGSYDAQKKEFTMTQQGINPGTGETAEITEVTRITDRDHHSYHMSMPGPDGNNAEMFTIEYSRKK